MYATELIKLLQAEVDKHGDLPVHYSNGGNTADVWAVHTYTKAGRDASYNEDVPPYHIYLH